MTTTARATIWIDLYGRTRQTTLKGNATLGGVMAALAALSDGSLLDCWEGPTMGPSGTAIAGPYNSVSDEALITYADGVGDLVNIVLPAPDSGIFQADGRTVNPAAVSALTIAATGRVITASGLAVATYVGGFRQPQRGGYY
jgi:hypothetical protein